MKVFKYVINPYDSEVDMPKYAKVLSVAFQGEDFCLWAEVDETNDTETRDFEIVGTGWDIPTEGYNVFIGTAHKDDGLVFHAFELLNYAKAIERGIA